MQQKQSRKSKLILRIKNYITFSQVTGSLAILSAVIFLFLPERIPFWAISAGVLGIFSLIANLLCGIYFQQQVHLAIRRWDEEEAMRRAEEWCTSQQADPNASQTDKITASKDK